MGLTDRLRDLDQKLLPGTREPDEDAETYLRRVAASRAITPAQAGDVMAALRVYFGVEPAAGDDDGDQDGDNDGEGEQKDEATESAGDEKDESEGGEEDSESKNGEEDESEEKSDDDEG